MDTAEDLDLCDEQREVLRRRHAEARRAGLTLIEARLFAESDRDIGELRQLVATGCPLDTIRAIVL